MAKVYKFDPVEITITNNAVDKVVERDAGAFNSQLVKNENGTVVGKTISGARTVQLFRINSFVTLMPGDSITLTTTTPAEIAYYSSLVDDEISVEPAIVTEDEAVIEETQE